MNETKNGDSTQELLDKMYDDEMKELGEHLKACHEIAIKNKLTFMALAQGDGLKTGAIVGGGHDVHRMVFMNMVEMEELEVIMKSAVQQIDSMKMGELKLLRNISKQLKSDSYDSVAVFGDVLNLMKMRGGQDGEGLLKDMMETIMHNEQV